MDTLIVKPATSDMMEAITAVLKAMNIDFEKSKAVGYNAEILEKVRRGDEAHARGDYKSVKVEDLWK